MDDGTALLAAIAMHPDEDVPRLAYADWLDEHNSPLRAEFIRVQCELARHKPIGVFTEALDSTRYGYPVEHLVTGYKWSEETQALQRRERELWRSLRSNALVLGDTTYTVGLMDEVRPCRFRRGFLHAVELAGADWTRHGDAILAAHPVQQVTLTTLPRLHQVHIPETPHLSARNRWSILGRNACYEVPITESRPYDVGGMLRRGMVLELLNLDPGWKRVKAWNLPVITPMAWQEFTDEHIAAAREAGQRSAMRENEAFLRAFLGEPESTR